MSDLTREDVLKVAKLCKLRLDDAHVAEAQTRLSAVLTHIDRLSKLDLDGVDPMPHVGDEFNRLDDDTPHAALSPDDLKRIAPKTYEAIDLEGQTNEQGEPDTLTFIAVPKVLGDGGGA